MGRAGTADTSGADDRGRAARRATRQASRRQSILDAAAEEFADSGYEGATLERIGERVGLSKASLYYYVSGKDQLFGQIVGQFVDRMEARVADHLAANDSLGALRSLVAAHLSAVSEPSGRALAANLHVIGSDGLRDQARRYEQLVARIIEQGIATERIRVVAVRPAVKLIIGALHGVAQWFRPDGPLALDEVVDGVVGVFLSGVASRPIV